MNKHWFFALAPLLGAVGQGGAAVPAIPGCRAQLEARLVGEQLTLVGHCQNAGPAALSLRYELLTDKKGRAGTSRNAQSGTFTVAALQTATLSQTTINVAPADYYRVQLRVLDLAGTVVAEDSLVHRP